MECSQTVNCPIYSKYFPNKSPLDQLEERCLFTTIKLRRERERKKPATVVCTLIHFFLKNQNLKRKLLNKEEGGGGGEEREMSECG